MNDPKDPESRPLLSRDDIIRLEEYVLGTGFMTHENARSIIDWFLNDLGIDRYYFEHTAIEEIGRHLIAISASRLAGRFGGEGVGVQLMDEREDRAVYIVEEESSRTGEIEQRIERRYPLYRVQSYISREKSGRNYLRLYFTTRPLFRQDVDPQAPLTFEAAAGQVFLSQSDPRTVERYRQAWEAMNYRPIPYISVTDKPETDETRVMIGIHSNRTQDFLTAFSHLFYRYGVHSNRKYREIFRDNKKVYTFYFNRMDPSTVEEFSRDLLGVVMLPEHPVTRLFEEEIYSPHETIYAIAAASFAHQFLSVMTEEYATLAQALSGQPEARGILESLRLRMTKDAYSDERIAAAVMQHSDLVAQIYRHFTARLHPTRRDTDPQALEKEILYRIEKQVPTDKDRLILRFFLDFNRAILKTNFFMRDKRCLAFQMDPAFLSPSDYPERPFGLYFFVGREFLGFHMRFRSIARGGIRIVKSRNRAQYEGNLSTIFLENYNLASTQQKKNKDIPEGGSKGTLLLYPGTQEEEAEAFYSYIDSMLDLLTPEPEVLDTGGERDILFLGPDERTAELMNWAALYARRRQYPFWKAFTTGKAPDLGGIPHDLYGMTTAGVHEYVLAVLEKLGLKEEELVKFQTGGPDGDLGSNEILISRDRTRAVVDGSGVLYDPAGLDRAELVRLARARRTAEHFDRGKLTPGGFFVSVADREVTLPDGSFVPNGEDFRNKFHLHPLAAADLFVPCGGRPAAININNWRQVLDAQGRPRFRIVVEGANLFITEEARLRLEEHGVILIKDASANKGGVTSSSLEVLASLATDDEEYERHLTVKDGKVPAFRRAYVEEILARIRANARSEFELLWSEHQARGAPPGSSAPAGAANEPTGFAGAPPGSSAPAGAANEPTGFAGAPFTLLTNQVSRRINDLTDAVVSSRLPEDRVLRERVLAEYVPAPLLRLVGLEKILERVPESYQRAIVGASLATRFVYRYGLSSTEVDFYDFVHSLIVGKEDPR